MLLSGEIVGWIFITTQLSGACRTPGFVQSLAGARDRRVLRLAGLAHRGAGAAVMAIGICCHAQRFVRNSGNRIDIVAAADLVRIIFDVLVIGAGLGGRGGRRMAPSLLEMPILCGIYREAQ